MRRRTTGRGITSKEVRATGYWILGGLSAVGSYIARCVVCRRLRATVQEQKMADLLEDRLEPSPPFANCAVAYFGPWIIKDGRKEVRRYGVIFTCLASRTVHLDTAPMLKKDAFINVPRRFVCGTGPIR